jgi:hypothetical protein
MTEILVIVGIALAIFMLPRLMGKQVEKGGRRTSVISKMNGWVRLAVLASVLWLAVMAFSIKPWNNHWPTFIYAGLGPVALLWGVFWVLSGFRKGGRKR